MNLDGTLKNPPGPPKSKGEIKARDAASKAKLQAKKDALRLAFVTHRDALEKEDKWTGSRKFQDWLEDQGWAALKASPPAAAPDSAASSASPQPSAAEKDDANRKRNINRINCKCPPVLCLALAVSTERSVLCCIRWCCGVAPWGDCRCGLVHRDIQSGAGAGGMAVKSVSRRQSEISGALLPPELLEIHYFIIRSSYITFDYIDSFPRK